MNKKIILIILTLFVNIIHASNNDDYLEKLNYYMEKKQPELLQTYLRKEIELNPKKIKPYIAMIALYIGNGNYESAIKLTHSALKLELNEDDKKLTSMFYLQLGDSYLKLDNHKKAKYFYNLGIKKTTQNKIHSLLYNRLAILELYDSRYLEALNFINESQGVYNDVSKNINK